jgi:hypothetical protein
MNFWVLVHLLCNRPLIKFIHSCAIELSILELELFHGTSLQLNYLIACLCIIVTVGLLVRTVHCESTTIVDLSSCPHNHRFIYCCYSISLANEALAFNLTSMWTQFDFVSLWRRSISLLAIYLTIDLTMSQVGFGYSYFVWSNQTWCMKKVVEVAKWGIGPEEESYYVRATHCLCFEWWE